VSITQTLKSHNFRYGWEYMVQQQADGSLGASSGTFAFGTNWTTLNPDATAGTGVGSSTASMLLGLPNSGSFPTAATSSGRSITPPSTSRMIGDKAAS